MPGVLSRRCGHWLACVVWHVKPHSLITSNRQQFSCIQQDRYGVILDSSMSMRQHIAKVTSTCFFHLRRLRKIGKVLDQDNRNRLVCAFILTRIDYCNALFAGLPDYTCAVATCPSWCCSICRGPSTTRPCNGDNDKATLPTSSSAYHV